MEHLKDIAVVIVSVGCGAAIIYALVSLIISCLRPKTNHIQDVATEQTPKREDWLEDLIPGDEHKEARRMLMCGLLRHDYD